MSHSQFDWIVYARMIPSKYRKSSVQNTHANECMSGKIQ